MHRQELVSSHEALLHATNPEALQMALRGIGAAKAPTENNNAHKPAASPPKPPPKPPVSAGDEEPVFNVEQ
jgi:hypothetical protein